MHHHDRGAGELYGVQGEVSGNEQIFAPVEQPSWEPVVLHGEHMLAILLLVSCAANTPCYVGESG